MRWSSYKNSVLCPVVLYPLCAAAPVNRHVIITGVVDEIDHKIISDFNPPLTLILCRWIRIDHQYRPYSPVGESLSTVDIARDWLTGSINRWISIDIQIDVGTISHHSWDHDYFVDVYPGPFLINSGTIWDHKSWCFFPWLLGKTRSGPKAKRLKRHTSKRKWSVGTQIGRYRLSMGAHCSLESWWCAPGSLHTKSLETLATRVVTGTSRVSALVQVYMYV